jgi:hypothetical protein
MKRHFVLLVVGFVVCFSIGAAAQQPAPAPAPPATPAPTGPFRQVPARPAPAAVPAPPTQARPAQVRPAQDSASNGQVVNIRLEVSISDQSGTVPTQPKVLTLLLADQNSSRLRSSFEDRTISMDARPAIVDGKIRLTLTMDNQGANNPAGSKVLFWTQSLTTIVDSGKPLVVLENSDPSNNRKLSVEVKATILK